MAHSHTRLSAAGIDYANMVARLSESAEVRRGDPQVEDAIRQIEDLGVSFDGHQYRYRGYSYDLLKDAVSYALLDRARSEHPGESAKEWLDPDSPTAADEESMRKLHVTFDGHRYHFAGYRYDRLADACRYAELKQKH
ncbi:MAG TPA: hypothetical protein VF816_06870 [Rhodocyclaceae bacterium]